MAVMEDDLTQVFSALADPTRRAILDRLANGEATVNELAAPFAMSQQAISKHLSVLERAHLISRKQAGRARACVLQMDSIDGAAGWIERHRRLWADRYDRLDEHLSALSASDRKEPGQ